MRKRIRMLLPMVATLAVLVAVLASAGHAMAADVALTKGVTPTTPNWYRLGDTIYYEMTVGNVAYATNESIAITTVWDILPDGSNVTPVGPLVDPLYILEVGEQAAYSYDWVATVKGQVTNTFYATGYQISTFNDTFTQQVQKSSIVIDPSIEIVKYVNGDDANSPIGPGIYVGDSVNFTYEVTNNGTLPLYEYLANIMVVDDNGTAGNTSDDFSPVPVDVSPADGYNDGDADKDNKLDVGETWLYSYTGVAAIGQHENIATARGTPEVGANVTDTDPANYHGVDVRISISPLTDDNEVGSNHTLTILLEKSVEDGVWTPLAGETVTASLSNGDGATAAFVGSNSGTTNSTGQFDVIINSPTAGNTTVEADWAGGTVEGAVVTVKTTDPDADKDWVDVRISITPLEDTNPVGTNHTLTILLEKSVVGGVWTPFAGETVTASLSNSGGATAAFVGSNSGTTNSTGQFDVIINSPTAGNTTVEADWAGGTVEGAVISAKTTDPDAVKQWFFVDVRISISPLTDANEVGTNHTLTILLEKSVEAGVWTPFEGETVTASLSNDGGATAAFVGSNSGTTNSTGQFDVIINSPTAGNTTVEADWAGGIVEEATVTARTTDPDADKDWVDVRISITPLEDTNPVGTNHTLTILLEKSVVAGVWTPFAGETVTASLSNSGGATAAFVGSNSGTTNSTGQFDVIINSPTAGSTTVEADWAGGTVEGAVISAKTTDPDAVKHWEGGGGEGCTPGYWKNNAAQKDAVSWVSTGYSPSDKFSDVFGVNITVRAGGRRTITDPTLLEALGATGGGVNALARHGVAALLNSAHPGISYDMGEQDVIDLVYDALTSTNPDDIGAAHIILADYNESGCPINQQGEPEIPDGETTVATVASFDGRHGRHGRR